MNSPRSVVAALAFVFSYFAPPIPQANAQVLSANLQFTSTLPCRIIDTRGVGQRFAVNQTRTFNVYGTNLSSQGGNSSGCSIPGFAAPGLSQVAALAINFVAVNPAGPGHLTVWPSDQAMPGTSVLNFQALSPNLNIANEVPTGVRQDASGNDFSINASQAVDVVADVVGYYSPSLRQTQLNATSPNLIGGFSGNSVTAGVFGATISGGGGTGQINSVPLAPNLITGDFGTVGGGTNNEAGSGIGATVGGGGFNTAGGDTSTVGGGTGNTASAPHATVAGGKNNAASGNGSTVAGGKGNTAAGDSSFAAGSKANIALAHSGTFIFADFNNFPFNSLTGNEFAVRSIGGARFVSGIDGSGNPNAGVTLAPGGGAWASLSDRDAKTNFSSVDGSEVLQKVTSLPVQTWSYKSQDVSVRHIGPVAQDFYAAFKVGEDNKHITTVDADGVALAAIQGLYKVLKEKDAEIREMRASQQKQAAAQQKLIRALGARLSALEQTAAEAAAAQDHRRGTKSLRLTRR